VVISKIQDFSKKITWLGHDGFRINTQKSIYFDPFQIKGGPEADLILVSHEHYDHCSPEDIAKIQSVHTLLITTENSADKLSGHVRIMRPGESFIMDNIKIETIPAYNTEKSFHPKSNNGLGFIVECEGISVYHAGDTDFIPEMRDLQVDIALIPVSGTYVMDAEQAVKATLAINPKLAIPMHYGAIVGSPQDAIKFKDGLAGKINVLVFEKE
jgi:L-ascorbate metabolism protein UlaG (beta-lactamase superfamily)